MTARPMTITEDQITLLVDAIARDIFRGALREAVMELTDEECGKLLEGLALPRELCYA